MIIGYYFQHCNKIKIKTIIIKNLLARVTSHTNVELSAHPSIISPLVLGLSCLPVSVVYISLLVNTLAEAVAAREGKVAGGEFEEAVRG